MKCRTSTTGSRFILLANQIRRQLSNMLYSTYNTTLRSIIPLPDPDSATHLSSHPSNLEDFPRDSIVLALYPDTTSFYRTTVVAAPMPGTGHGHGVRGQGANSKADPGAKRGMYRLLFVDDDGNVQDVQKDYVVAVSTSFHDGGLQP